METYHNPSTTLSDDIQHLTLNVYGKELDITRLCKDHHNPYLHYDQKPVLNITQDEFLGIFDLNSNHFFLSPDQACRLGEYYKLALPNIIALMLKAEWEYFLFEMYGYNNKSELNLKSLLSDQNLIEKYFTGFQPDRRKILSAIGNIKHNSDVDKQLSHIDFYVSDLLKEKKFLIENQSISQLYPENDINEKILLQNITESEREEYFRAKELWKLKSIELDDMLLFLERRKKLNIGIENKYLRIFAKIETEKSKFKYNFEKYKIILIHMQDYPELPYRDLLKLAIENLTEAERERKDLYQKIVRCLNCIGENIAVDSYSLATSELKNSYLQACKKLLRKLFFLLHSDTCPGYSELSGKKKGQINKLWLELMKSTKNELYSYSPKMLLYDLPDYERLEYIYKKACEILEIEPEDIELGNHLEFMIKKGIPVNQLIEFLKNETDSLELHLAHLEIIQNDYTNEDLTQYYRDALADIDVHSERLKNEISDLKKKIKELKKKISNRLKIENREEIQK